MELEQLSPAPEAKQECARCLALDTLRELDEGGAVAEHAAGRPAALRMLLSAFALSAGRMCGACLRMQTRELLQRLGELGAIVVVGLMLAACGGDSSKPSACVAPSGVWSLSLSSADCGSQTIQEDFTKLSASDDCVLLSQSFDDEVCVFMQEASCAGFDATVVFTLNASGNSLTGTTTVENDDGSICDFDVTGKK